MELADLVNQVGGFDAKSPREKIRLFAWFAHTHLGKPVLSNADVRACFTDLHLADPNVATYVGRMITQGDFVKAVGGVKLARAIRTLLDQEHGVHQSVVQVSKLLGELPGKVPDLAEKNFLAEAIKCYRVEAYRACVVMTWNLSYSHLLHWVLKDARRLSDFNAAIGKRYPKKPTITIATYDEFLDQLKESEVIEICSSAGLISGNVARLLREKLGKRNTAAHPSSIVVVRSQADDVITDLVNNVLSLS
jgi:hypothetical protein